MASKRLQSWLERLLAFLVVSPALMLFGSSRRNDTNNLASHRVGDIEQAALDHPHENITVLTIVFAVVEPRVRKDL
jgi:hypothetical protein